MRAWLRSTWESLRSSYWFIPSLMAIASVFLALVSLRLDEHFRDEALRKQGWTYSGGPEGARAVLSAIASSIITVAGTTFSITIAALSLASAQFGPRLLRNFMRDTANQVVLGAFTSTFLYCLLILRTVRGLEESTYVPHISVTTAVALAVINVGVLIFFIHHIAESIQVTHVIDIVGRELHEAIARLFPERASGTEDDQELPTVDAYEVTADRDGYLQTIEEQELIARSEKSGVVLKLLRRPGDYIIFGMPLLAASAAMEEQDVNEIRAAFTIGRSRTPQQDSVFAFHQLAEVAMRALSPGVNDPFTAITCIDRITSAITQLSDRSLPAQVFRDAAGRVCMIAYPYTYEDLVEAGYRHIREAAQDHWQVRRHLKTQLIYAAAHASHPRLKDAILKELSAMG